MKSKAARESSKKRDSVLKAWRSHTIWLFSGLVIFLWSFSSCPAAAQQWELLREQRGLLPENGSVDRYGNWFIAETDGTLRKFAPEGTLEEVFSPPLPAKIGALEAWPTIAVYVLQPDFQQYFMLNRLLSLQPAVALPEQETGWVTALTPSANGALWLYDRAGLRLLLFDPAQGRTLWQTRLDLLLHEQQTADFTFLREYQNKLFAAHPKGIFVFDLMGNLLNTLPLPAAEWFGFADDQVYTLQPDGLHWLHLYTSEQRKEALPANGVRKALYANGYLCLLLPDRVLFYKRTDR